MFSFGSKLKFFLGTVSKPRLALGRGGRTYATHPGDEDIKWQWAVRDSPCTRCAPYKRPGWLARVLCRKKAEELTNRHLEVVRRPRMWELEYYSYLLPDCEKKGNEAKKKLSALAQTTNFACPAKDYWCEGKRTVVDLKDDSHDDLKPLTEPLGFKKNPPFCLNEVCGKVKTPEPEAQADPTESFKCLNDFVEAKEKEGEKSNEKGCK